MKHYYYEDLSSRYRGSMKEIPTLRQCERHWHYYKNICNDQVELQRGDDRIRHLPNVNHLVLSGTAWKLPFHPLTMM